MATIKIENLTCENPQEENGYDEINILLNGSKFAGPFSMRRGRSVTPSATAEFAGTSARIALMEVDPGNGTDNDEALGSHAVGTGDRGESAFFTGRRGTVYTMKYSVFR
jgi:hypothetical protein